MTTLVPERPVAKTRSRATKPLGAVLAAVAIGLAAIWLAILLAYDSY